MSDANFSTTDVVAVRAPRAGTRVPKTDLPSIVIDSQTWDARKKLAAALGICDTTLARKNYPTMFVGGVAYLCREDTLREMANEARRRNEASREGSASASVRRRQGRR
jgi:hypothetical protein